jgi:hypothetical protein
VIEATLVLGAHERRESFHVWEIRRERLLAHHLGDAAVVDGRSNDAGA